VNRILRWIRSKFFPPKRRRLQLVFLPYEKADDLLRLDPEHWQIATKEEDRNQVIGWVYLERLE
jgi:hypothetical protein